MALLGEMIPAQELLWQIQSTATENYGYIARSFGDLNHDGYDDLLVTCWIPYETVRILSGADGSVLYQRQFVGFVNALVGVGDFDGDGYPDFAVLTQYVPTEVWSPHLDQRLMQATGNLAGSNSIIAGNVDLNGDGLPDLLIGTIFSNYSDVYAYDHGGSLLYRIPALALGYVVRDIAGVGDLDGDGRDDYVVGLYGLGDNHGHVALISGRTGTLLRLHTGPQQNDFIGFPVGKAGDMDGDGVMDYFTGSYLGYRGLVIVYSGATGAVIRLWDDPYLDNDIIGGRDVDLDGVPDIIVNDPGYPNPSLNPSLPPGAYAGRVQVYSARDQQDIMWIRPQQPGSLYAYAIADLGVQPGSPYPVFAQVDRPDPYPYPRIQVWRCTPAGSQQISNACGSTSVLPTIGIRRVFTPTGEDSRLVLGYGMPGTLAVCCVAPAGATAWQGSALPLSLDPVGFAGCSLRVPPDASAFRIVGSAGMDAGYAAVDLSPALVATGGSAYAAQWLLFDPLTLGYGATARQQFRVQ